MFISTQDLEKIHQDNSVLILDARSYKDYSAGHIPGSVSLDLLSFHWADTSQKGLVSFGEHMRKILSYLPFATVLTTNLSLLLMFALTGQLGYLSLLVAAVFALINSLKLIIE